MAEETPHESTSPQLRANVATIATAASVDAAFRALGDALVARLAGNGAGAHPAVLGVSADGELFFPAADDRDVVWELNALTVGAARPEESVLCLLGDPRDYSGVLLAPSARWPHSATKPNCVALRASIDDLVPIHTTEAHKNWEAVGALYISAVATRCLELVLSSALDHVAQLSPTSLSQSLLFELADAGSALEASQRLVSRSVRLAEEKAPDAAVAAYEARVFASESLSAAVQPLAVIDAAPASQDIFSAAWQVSRDLQVLFGGIRGARLELARAAGMGAVHHVG
jgi:hypothetical protein